MDSIHQIVRDAEDNYVHGTSKISKYVEHSMYETISTIEAYSNSKHTSGATDSLNREKPFFNIVTAAANIWYRATDLDRKNIRIVPNKSSAVALSFLATVHLQNWMDKNRFGVFLNTWGRTLAKYGSAIVKFVEKDGNLVPSVVPWGRFIADPIDFTSIPRIEKFYKTPAQLRKMAQYNQEVVKQLLDAQQSRETLEGHQKDNEANYIELYEIHGELPEYFLDGDKPDDKDIKYRQQMHVVSFVGKGTTDASGKEEYNDFTLYKGKEKQDPYMITHLIEEDDRTLAIGAVEYLFDSQWMQNHTMKQWKDQLDLSSKLIFQTADTNYVGRNVLTAIEVGDVMVHELNKPLTLINNQGHDVTSLQNFGSLWKSNGQELSNTPDLFRGITQAQPVTYGLGQIMNENTSSLFNLMKQNKCLHLEDMLKTFVIPHLKSKLDTKEEIVATLDDQGIAQIDSIYLPKEAIRRYNKRTIKKVLDMPIGGLNGAIPSPFMPELEQSNIKKELSALGNQRFFKPDELDEESWKEVMSDVNWDNVKVEVGNENSDKQAILTTLNTALQTIASNPAVLQDPNAKLVFSKILRETSVVSPMELSTSLPTSAPPVGGEAALPASTS